MKLKLPLLSNFVNLQSHYSIYSFKLRYFIEFAYNGKNYHGFQTQPNASSVQETLTKALQLLIDKSIEIVRIFRTKREHLNTQVFILFGKSEQKAKA